MPVAAGKLHMDFTPDPWPCIVVSKDNAKGFIVAIDNDGPFNNSLYLVVMKDTGEFWEVPSTDVRMQRNWTMRIKYE